MATANDVDMRGWYVHPTSPKRDGNNVLTSRSASFDIDFGANRTSGVAPLGVMFTAGFDESSGSSRDFHDLHYEWDFGDTGAGTWGTNGKSRNADTGPVAAHVFESAGTYTVGLTVRNPSGSIARSESVEITVTDPDTVFSGTNTIVVNQVGDTDFTGKPTGATEVNSDDFDATLTTYLASGKRILFKRGNAFASSASANVADITTAHVGAYGTGTSPDAQGHYSNAPLITVAAGVEAINLDNHTDLRITDLAWTGGSTTSTAVIGGNLNIRHLLVANNKTTDMWVPIGWSNYRYGDSDKNENNYVVNNNVTTPNNMGYYIGSEYLTFIGNKGADSDSTHVSRVWQSYIGVINHNDLSGANILNSTGRHALKLHGPAEDEVGTFAETSNGGLANRTKMTVIGSNMFGSSGPWPVALGPTDGAQTDRLSDIILEKNKYIMQYGNSSSEIVSIAFKIWSNQTTVRNNIIDATRSTTNSLTGIEVALRGVEWSRDRVYVYNNTIFTNDAVSPGVSYGVRFSDATATNIFAYNNLVSMPNATTISAITDNSGNLVESNNLRIDDPLYVDPTNATPLSRDYALQATSTAIDQGVSVPVYDDYNDTARTGTFDLGAISYEV